MPLVSHPFYSCRCSLPNFCILSWYIGDKSAAINAILALVNEDIEKEDHVMKHRFANRIIKAMVKADSSETDNDKGKFKRDSRKGVWYLYVDPLVCVFVAVEPLNFAPQLLEVIRPNLSHFATTHGSFVVLALAEEPSTAKDVKKELKAVKKEIKNAAEEKNAGAVKLAELL